MKKIISVVLVAVMLLALLPAAATVNAATYSGKCGDNVTWSLNTSTGVLNISGTGDMRDYGYESNSRAPYLKYPIVSVEISDGVTSIGDNAFYECSSLMSVKIPNSVTIIGDRAFVNCIRLTSITIPESVTSIGKGVFDSCSSFKSITGKPGSYAETCANENGISFVGN